MTDDELRELIPLAALDALDADERAAFDEAIATRPELQAELDSLRAVTAALPGDVSVPPPARLKAAVLAEIATTDQLGPEDATEAAPSDDGGTGPAPLDAPPAPADEAVAPPPPPAKVVPLRRRWVLAAAAAAVLVVAGVGAWLVIDSNPSEQEQAQEVVERSDAQTLPLTGALEGVRIVYSPSSDDAALVADQMPPPGEDSDYQLWSIRGSVIESEGVFQPDADGSVLVLVEDYEPGAVMAITAEPAGGSEQPTSDPLVASA